MTLHELYEAGLRGGAPPSSRFDLLNGRAELLTPLVTLALGHFVQRAAAWSNEPWRHAWRQLHAALRLTDQEAAFLLGIWHDAEPEGRERIPVSVLTMEAD